MSGPVAVSADPTQPDSATHVAVDCDAGLLWLPRDDRVMLPVLQHRRAWDEATGGLLRTLVRSNFAVLDVGAGVGYHALLAKRNAPGVQVDAVESDADSLPLLRWNLWRNGAGDTAVHQVRLGDGGEDTVRADDHFAGRRFDVVRVDLHGHEPEALRGMQALLRGSPRVVVMVAFWPHALRARGADPHQVLREYRGIGLERRAVVSHTPQVLDDDVVVLTCDNAGPSGRVNLLLR